MLTEALKRFLTDNPGSYQVCFDATACRYDLGDLQQASRLPGLNFRLLRDVEAELGLLLTRLGDTGEYAASARFLLRQQWVPACLTDLYRSPTALREPPDRLVFLFGSLLAAQEFSRNAPPGAWMLRRRGWSLDRQGEILPARSAACLIRGVRHDVGIPAPRPGRVPLRVVWNGGAVTRLPAGLLDGRTPAFRGGESLLYALGRAEGMPSDGLLLRLEGVAHKGTERAAILRELSRQAPLAGLALPEGLVFADPPGGQPLLVGSVIRRRTGSPLSRELPARRQPLLRSLLALFLVARLYDLSLVDLSLDNLLWNEQTEELSAVDSGGFQVRRFPALSAHDTAYPGCNVTSELLTPSRQAFGEAAFLLHLLLLPQRGAGSSPAFYRTGAGARRFRHTAEEPGWPARLSSRERQAMLDELNSPAPPLRSIGDWAHRLLDL